MCTPYIIITPVRNEQRYIRHTIECVVSQTCVPLEWVIVDDGSRDLTGAIIDAYAERVPWIHALHRPDRGFRKAGGGVMEAFYDGYEAVLRKNWQFLVKLDGDLSFGPEYFERCFEYFHREPGLGIGGGVISYARNGEQVMEEGPRFHVRGATKIYRRECWEAIGGLWPNAGWDTIDEVKANMAGWKTQTFPDLCLLHHRLTGSAEGLVPDRVKHGLGCYVTGYHPLFVAASCLRRLTQKPFLLGSAAIFYGFVKGYFTRPSRLDDPRAIRFVRHQQLRRLCGLSTIWK